MNKIGDAGLIALAAPLRKLLRLEELRLHKNQIGDEGVAALVAPGEAVLPSLKVLYLENNSYGDAGCASLVTAIDSGNMPALEKLVTLPNNSTSSDKAQLALWNACERRGVSTEDW